MHVAATAPVESAHERELRAWAEALAASHPPLTDQQLDSIGTRLRDARPMRGRT